MKKRMLLPMVRKKRYQIKYNFVELKMTFLTYSLFVLNVIYVGHMITVCYHCNKMFLQYRVYLSYSDSDNNLNFSVTERTQLLCVCYFQRLGTSE